MDIFKNLPFDLQEKIYKDVIYKKNHDNFIKNFDCMIKDILFYFHIELQNGEIFPFEAKHLLGYMKEYEDDINDTDSHADSDISIDDI